MTKSDRNCCPQDRVRGEKTRYQKRFLVCQFLQHTALTIRLVGQVHGPLS
jgi:hypothetical protein